MHMHGVRPTSCSLRSVGVVGGGEGTSGRRSELRAKADAEKREHRRRAPNFATRISEPLCSIRILVDGGIRHTVYTDLGSV